MVETASAVNSENQDFVSRALHILKRGDIAFALGLIFILVVLIMPMPSWLLDICLALSITFAVMIFMTGIFIEKPLEFNSFPTILLIATMIRLALNLASTRLILSEGHQGTDAAGYVIQAFGNFVMGGNFVIGMIVFSILVIVNFVVITKGSGRIAEVSARFSLDAMPGKQMAIDADLSAGLIDEQEAKQRRKDLEDESNFFGAMDGASKFVRGDAIAGILITFINVIGGLIIGTVEYNLPVYDAASKYTLLTVGDGLVSQIPALIVSTAAGLLVSKSGVTGPTNKALFGQLSGYPSSIGLSSFLLLCLAFLPGMPFLPFISLSGIMGYLAYYMSEKQKKEAQEAVQEKQEATQVEEKDIPIEEAMKVDDIKLELGISLLQVMRREDGPKLPEQIKALRKQIALEMGFVMPSVRIQDNVQLDKNTYAIKIKEIEAGRGEIQPDMLLTMNPSGQNISLPGRDTIEPTFGLPAKWVPETAREEALFNGYTVVDPQTVISTHLTELIKEHMTELLSYTETKKLIDGLEGEHQKLVADVIPGQMTLSAVQKVLQNLLKERLSIRDLPTILEGIAEGSLNTKSILLVTEHVRTKLARQICTMHANHEGVLPIVTLSADWEQAFADHLIGNDEEKQLAMPPSQLQEFMEKTQILFEELVQSGEIPVLVTSSLVRPYVRSIIERFRPLTAIMSQAEIHPKAQIKTIGRIE